MSSHLCLPWGGRDTAPWYNGPMVTAGRVIWRALVHLYDESLLMIRANVVWFVGSIPLFLLVLVASWLFVLPMESEEGPVIWPLMLAAYLLLVIPNPLSLGTYALGAEIVTGDTPEFRTFWLAVRRWWKRGLVLFFIGSVVLAGLLFNTSFYLSVTQGWLQAISIVWLYAILFWLTMQQYLGPLMLSSDEAAAGGTVPLGALYKRAAILTLANPVLSLAMLLMSIVILLLSALAVPIYPLVAHAYLALIGSRALRELRLKYFPEEAAETEEAAE